MRSYKLTYFNISGRAEPIRILFALAKVPFEDVRISLEEWAKLKSDAPQGTLPILSVDGAEIGQSQAIMRYLAREFGYAGTDSLSCAIVDSLADLMGEFFTTILPWHGARIGIMPGDRAELFRTVFIPSSEKYFPLFEKALAKSSTGWLSSCSDLPTHADLFVGCNLEMLLRLVDEPVQLLVDFPLLAAHQKKFLAHPTVAQHIANRPKDLWF